MELPEVETDSLSESGSDNAYDFDKRMLELERKESQAKNTKEAKLKN